MAAQGDEVTIGELGRRLDRVDTSIDGLRAELRDTLAAAVLTARYEPEQRSIRADVAELRRDLDGLVEAQAEDQRARERTRVALIVATISAVVGPIVVALVLSQLLTPGGPTP